MSQAQATIGILGAKTLKDFLGLEVPNNATYTVNEDGGFTIDPHPNNDFIDMEYTIKGDGNLYIGTDGDDPACQFEAFKDICDINKKLSSTLVRKFSPDLVKTVRLMLGAGIVNSK